MTPQKLKWYQAYREAHKEQYKESYRRWYENKGRQRYLDNIELIRIQKRKNYYLKLGNFEAAQAEQAKVDAYRLCHPRKRAGTPPVLTPEEAIERRQITLRKARYKRMGIADVPLTKTPETCEICGGTRKISMDHCHVKKVFRGWLCDDCNLALGRAKDSIPILKRMIKYLKKAEVCN
jgi:hypothetical protein